MIVLIDNYDSFTFNLWHALAACGVHVEVRRNDDVSVDEVLAMRPTGIVLSPGPRSPDEAGICVELVRAASTCPAILGVCLGHQAIARAFGASVVRGAFPMHGRQSLALLEADELFAGISSPMTVGRYHSLVVDAASLPEALIALGTSTEPDQTRTLMAVRHRSLPTWGVQFHPESVLSPEGPVLVRNFVNLARRYSNLAGRGNDES